MSSPIKAGLGVGGVNVMVVEPAALTGVAGILSAKTRATVTIHLCVFIFFLPFKNEKSAVAFTVLLYNIEKYYIWIAIMWRNNKVKTTIEKEGIN